MLPLPGVLLAVDAEDEDPVEEGPRNDYLSRKDLKWMGVVLIILILVGAPIYIQMREDYNKYQCQQNFKAMGEAIAAYASQWDDHFPPLYVRQMDTDLPRLDSKGRPFTWASTLINIAGFDNRRSFACPAASEDETVIAEGVNGKDLPMTYGMYAAYDHASRSDARDAGTSVLLAETSNGGSNDTFDPSPIKPGGAGSKVIDGFIIGWKTGDTIPNDGKLPEGGVTRLAFRDTKNGLGEPHKAGRHNEVIHVLYVDGHYGRLNSSSAAASGYWQLPR